MGTYVSGVILLDADPGFHAVAQRLAPVLHANGAQKAILTRQPIILGSANACWYAVTDQHGYAVDEQGEIGRIASELAAGSALWIHYSDSTGKEAFKLFHAGQLGEHSENTAPPRSAFPRAFQVIGLQATVREPEDLVDILQLSELPGDAAWLIRRGKLLALPEVVQSKPEHPPLAGWQHGSDFEALRPLRSAFRALVWLFGALVVLLILLALGSYVWEIAR